MKETYLYEFVRGDGAYHYAKFSDVYDVLGELLRERFYNLNEWADFVKDAELVISAPKDFVYSENGDLYDGKDCAIDQFIEDGIYTMRMRSGRSEVEDDAYIETDARCTTMIFDREGKHLSIEISNESYLHILKTWYAFLCTDKPRETGKIEIDIIRTEVHPFGFMPIKPPSD